MVRKNIVVIRVVTLEDQTLLRMHGDLIVFQHDLKED